MAASSSTNLRQTVEFDLNVPVEVALKFSSGKIISTRNGERVMYTLCDERVMFLDLGPAEQINQLGINVRETFLVTKCRKGKEPVEWDIRLTAATERARALAQARQDGSDPDLVGKLYDSIPPKPGPQACGTMVVPKVVAAASGDAPATAQSAALSGHINTPNPTTPNRGLVEEANALVDAFAEVLSRALTKHEGRVKPDEVRSLLLSAYIQKGRAGSHA